MQFGLFDDESKRKPVRTSDRKHLLKFQKGKCWKCKKPFKQMGVRTVLHHKNLNPKDNRITNMILVCPNCHDKIHQKKKKVRVKTTDAFGFTEYKVVKKGTRKKSKSKKKKRGPAEYDIFGNVVRWKYVSSKPKKKSTAKKRKTTRKKTTTSKKRKIKKKTAKRKKKTTRKTKHRRKKRKI